jgi:hypothetical protein
MKYEASFVQSHQPYAIDMESLTITERERDRTYVWARVNAVWFRRRRAQAGRLRTVACAGELRELMDPEPGDVEDFLARFTDGRYGGDCRARWDGETLWTVPELTEEQRAGYLAVLRPALAAYPAVPSGTCGWYTFHERASTAGKITI